MNKPVVIIGAGPVGMTLAMDLAWRGIEVLVIEQRQRGEAPPPKCNHVSARTMEFFRRLGVAEKIRNAGLPADYPNDVSYRTTFTGTELTRIPIPCRRRRYDATEGPDVGWPTPEPPHRINQIYMEPILFEHLAEMPGAKILCRTALEDVKQNHETVTVTVRNLDSNETTSIECEYLVGCDGGRSLVRKAIGANFDGDAVLQRCQSTYLRAPSLIQLQSEAPAWATFSLNPRRSGNVYAIDGKELWVIHNYLREDELDFDAIDRDWGIRTILGVDDSFDYEVLSKEDWFGRRLVADKFRQGRIFICGDAAHIWVPYGGYGMNAGVADATNLSWLLAARLNGWGGHQVLDAYEAERRPITEQVSQYVMNHSHAMAKQRAAVPPNIEAPGPEGDAVRAQMGQRAYDLNVQQYCVAGLNFGYFYQSSPIIAHETEHPPPYTMSEFTPSTIPGCRTPHFFLEDGRSLYDALGPEYTLLRFDKDLDVSNLLSVAQQAGLPLVLLDITAGSADAAYDHKLIISRPDQHVAWRGDALPQDLWALVGMLRGGED